MKKLLPIFFLLALAIVAFLFIRGNRPSGSPASIWEQATEVKIDAISLFEAFQQDEAEANEDYLNKIIEVTGKISTVRSSENGLSVVLATNDPTNGVRCRLDNGPGQGHDRFEVGQTARFKCLCSGYIQDVEMVQCKEK